jgi:hypothetical protein
MQSPMFSCAKHSPVSTVVCVGGRPRSPRRTHVETIDCTSGNGAPRILISPPLSWSLLLHADVPHVPRDRSTIYQGLANFLQICHDTDVVLGVDVGCELQAVRENVPAEVAPLRHGSAEFDLEFFQGLPGGGLWPLLLTRSSSRRAA